MLTIGSRSRKCARRHRRTSTAAISARMMLLIAASPQATAAVMRMARMSARVPAFCSTSPTRTTRCLPPTAMRFPNLRPQQAARPMVNREISTKVDGRTDALNLYPRSTGADLSTAFSFYFLFPIISDVIPGIHLPQMYYRYIIHFLIRAKAGSGGIKKETGWSRHGTKKHLDLQPHREMRKDSVERMHASDLFTARAGVVQIQSGRLLKARRYLGTSCSPPPSPLPFLLLSSCDVTVILKMLPLRPKHRELLFGVRSCPN